MRPAPDPTSLVEVCARGVVDSLVVHHNTAGLPWVTFQLHTAAGPLPCVCFPRSFASASEAVARSRMITVRGQVIRGDHREMRVLQVDSSPV